MVLGSFYGCLGLNEVEYLLLGFFFVLSDCSSGKARVESLEFEEALNCVGTCFTFFGGVDFLVDILLNVYGSRMLGSERWR